MDAVGFRYSFTPLTGVLFTVPSRYCALSVTTSSSPWTVVGPDSHRISRVRWYSRWLPCLRRPTYGTLTRSGVAFQPLLWVVVGQVPGKQPQREVSQPQLRNACSLGTQLV